jgi:TetR/AcrR family transcriptional regulator, transcriptional repressor for nem operon
LDFVEHLHWWRVDEHALCRRRAAERVNDMRKSKEEAAETRRRIVEAASTEFRRDGIEGTGLADVMAAAGLTHGGFYKHFASKEQVVEEAFAAATDSMAEAMRDTMLASPGERGLHAMIAEYLSVQHRDDPACGCPFAALGSEVARGGDAVREATTASFLKVVDVIAGQLAGMSPAAARKQAMLMLSTMIGAMTMARVVADPDLSASILRQAYRHLTRSS